MLNRGDIVTVNKERFFSHYKNLYPEEIVQRGFNKVTALSTYLRIIDFDFGEAVVQPPVFPVRRWKIDLCVLDLCGNKEFINLNFYLTYRHNSQIKNFIA